MMRIDDMGCRARFDELGRIAYFRLHGLTSQTRDWRFQASSRAISAAILCCGVSIAVANGQTTAKVEMPPAMPANLQITNSQASDIAAPTSGRDAYRLESGDRLKVSIYGRDDLSGEYRISDEGQVRVPTLGAFDAASKTAGQLEVAIRTAVEQSLARQSFVAVDIVERQPVFVTGLVTKPGSYAFMPGMAVIHATAVAGGTVNKSGSAWLPTEALREGARFKAGEEEMKRLLARISRLLAERDGRSQVSVPKRLVDLTGQETAAQLIAEEQSIFDRQREGIARQVTALQAAIKETRNEVQAYENELKNIGEQRRLRHAAVESVRALSSRGLTTQQRLTDSEILLASIERDAQGAIANLARSKQTLERHDRDLALLTIDRNVVIEKELQTVDEQLRKLDATMQGSAKIVSHIGGLSARALSDDQEPNFQFEILRRGRDGRLTTVQATETTPLQPGDVVRASAARVQ